MLVALVHTDFRLYWPSRIMALFNYLNKTGDHLRVIEIAGRGSPYSFSGAAEHDAYWSCLFPQKQMEDIPSSAAAESIYQVLDEIHPDVVISGPIAYPSGAAAVRWARRRKKPVVIMDNARLQDVPRSPIVNWVKRRIYANVDALLIPALSHVRDYKFWGLAEEQMFFGVNVVDNDFFAVRAALARNNDEAVRAKYGLPKRFFLGIGRQIPKKNWLALIHAFASVNSTVAAEWGLVLVGDGPEAKRLQSAAEKTDGRVVFLPFQNQENLSEIYGVAVCFILPSLYGETWGNVINEAMACRLPVMVSEQCGCAETLVRDGYNGWQFDPHNNDQLAALINKFISLSEEERKQMGENSFQIIRQWALDRFCEGIWQAVQFCMKKPARGYAAPVIDRIILNLWKGRYRPV